MNPPRTQSIETPEGVNLMAETQSEISSDVEANLDNLNLKEFIKNSLKKIFENTPAICALIDSLFGETQNNNDEQENIVYSRNDPIDGVTVEMIEQEAVTRNIELTPIQREIFGWSLESLDHYQVPRSAVSVLFGFFKHESRFRTDAANPTSSARGLGQFLTSTWQGFVEREGPSLVASGTFTDNELRNPDARTENPRLMVYATTWYMNKNFNNLQRNGLVPNGWNTPNLGKMLYMCHHLGSGDGPKYLKYLQTGDQSYLSQMSHPDIAQNHQAFYDRVGASIDEFEGMFGDVTTVS